MLNGIFIAQTGKDYSGHQTAAYDNGKVLFDEKEFDELIFEPINGETSFDLINVVRFDNRQFSFKRCVISRLNLSGDA